MVAYDYSGKVAFVTGGTSGIGLATALALGRAGAKVTIAARGEAAGRAACSRLAEEGVDALFAATDVRDEASVERAIERTIDRFGQLDVAVNSAGIGGDLAPLERTNQDVWDEVMTVNARGVWLAMRYEIPAMLSAGGGAIVNLCSVFGMAGTAAHHAYVASKHAVLGMTRSVALEYATRGVRVNALCAGVTRTDAMRQAEELAPSVVEELVRRHPMARMALEEEIAGAALWLCSDGAGYMTGTPLAVDGGFLAA